MGEAKSPLSHSVTNETQVFERICQPSCLVPAPTCCGSRCRSGGDFNHHVRTYRCYWTVQTVRGKHATEAVRPAEVPGQNHATHLSCTVGDQMARPGTAAVVYKG